MLKLVTYLVFFSLTSPLSAQYYLRGEIRDEKKKPLSNARIFVHSLRAYFYSGASSGSFGISTKVLFDSLTITLEGYERLTVRVRCDQWQVLTLKASADAISKNQPRLISVTQDRNQTGLNQWFAGDETYFQLVENENVEARSYPVTGYSLNVNKASYSNVRRFLKMNSLVPPDAVRTEEIMNYFNLFYREPSGDSLFAVDTRLTSCPWHPAKQLFFINVSARKLSFDSVPPGNFVFLIDVSGSMDMPNRLPLLKAAFQLFVKNMRPVDSVSIVTYGGYVQLWLTATSGMEKEKILKAIEELEAEGDTPGESAIRMAYRVAARSFIPNGNNRVILATDGDFNVGETSEKALDDLITAQKQTGVYLTCLGVGMGNLKDSKLMTLAKKGNGNYAYLDDIREAERVLVKELTQTFYSVADDAFMGVKFNPERVQSYRLVGFDNKKQALADSANHLEGGEVGSGSGVTALFEILPAPGQDFSANVAELQLSYKKNRDSALRKMTFTAHPSWVTWNNADRNVRLSASLAMFSLKLKESKHMASLKWSQIRAYTQASVDPANYLQQEFLGMVDRAVKMYGGKRK